MSLTRHMKTVSTLRDQNYLWYSNLVGIFLFFGLAAPTFAAQADPAPMPDEVVQKLRPKTSASLVHPLPEQLHGHLKATLMLLEQIEEEQKQPGPGKGADKSSKPMLLGSKTHEIKTLKPELSALFSQLDSKLFPPGSGQQLIAWNDLLTKVENRLDEITNLLDDVPKSKNAAEQAKALAKAKEELHKILQKANGDPVGPGPIPTLTHDRPTEQKPEPNNAPAPLYLSSLENPDTRYAFLGLMILAALAPPTPTEASSCNYTAADLGQSQEVQITPEITALAESLGYSPVKIFQYVSNEIKFEPYYGSLKGAIGTLYTKASNATDQASLLIALLRASNVPARYVKGVAHFQGDVRVLDWVGAKSYYAAANILAQGRIPTTRLVSANGTTIGVDFTHVWAEACVPYGIYRGTSPDLTGFRWIPLDPSFKDKTYQAGITTNVDFDYTTYMATRSNDLPQEKYAEQVESYIKTRPPYFANNTLEDVGYIGTIVPLQLDFLPVSLPYPVVAYNAWDTGLTAETAELPDKHRYKFNITVKNSSGTALAATLTLSLPEVVLKRITLSFRGYTTTDQNKLDTWKSNPDTTTPLPCSENIQVVPVIKVEGVDKAVGTTPVGLCTTTNQLTLQITLADIVTTSNPNGRINEVNFSNIQAADYYALLSYAFQTSDRLLTEQAAKLLNSVRNTPNPNDNLEETEGEFLHLVGLKYMRYVADSVKSIGELDRGSGQSGHYLGLTSSRMKVKYLLDQPFAVAREGFLVDFPGVTIRNVDLTSGDIIWKSFLLMGYSSSAYESYIWQENARLDAVSSVRGIQFANETGIEVLKNLNSSNWAAEKPKLTSNANNSLNYSASQVTSIENDYINQGYTLTLPRSLIQYDNWKGYVFIAEKNNLPTSGSAAFIISGGYAGGFTTLPVPITFDENTDSGFVFVSPPSGDTTTTPAVVSSAVGPGNTQFDTFNGDPVNMVNGNMYHTERDIVIKGRGLPLVIERSYNSRNAKDGPLGFGWTHSFNHFFLFKDDNANGVVDAPDTDGITSSVSWVDGTGSEKFIQVTGTASGVDIGSVFTAPQGFFFQTSRNADGTYTIREKNGLTYTFENVAGTVGQKARILSIKDKSGNTLALNYTSALLTSVTDGLNRSLTFTYDGNSRISQICDWTNRCHQYGYDASGNLVTYKNPLAVAGTQNPVTYAYYSDASNPNINHAMKSYTLPRGNGMTFEYYINGKVFKHYNTLGEITTFTYNEFRRESISTNERGYKRQFFFDKFGNPTKIFEENGGERIYTYDTNNPMNRISKRDPMGYITTYTYDTNGNVTKITNPSGSTVEYFNFNAFNQPGKIKDARGNYTILKYDSQGNLLQTIRLKSGIGATIDPATYTPGASDIVSWTINSYDASGNLLTTKQVKDFASQAGPTVTFTYDAQGLNALTVARSGDGILDTANLTYDSLGRVTVGLSPDWYQTQFVYDQVDRVIRGTDTLGNLRDYAYDANGNLVSNSLTSGGSLQDQTTFAYDLSDRRITSTNAGNFTTTYQYDAAGNVITTTNPDGRTLSFEYDSNNKVIMAFDEGGHAVTRTLDLDGKPRTVTDPNGSTTSYEYYGPEREGRLKIKRDPLARATTYDYDANGNVISVTDMLGRTTLTTYDELNRPTRIVGPVVGTLRPVTKNSYDTLGRLIQVDAGRTDSSGTNPAGDVVSTQMGYQYDDFGRKIRESDGLGRSWNFQYDKNGNPVVASDAKGQATLLTYKYGHQLMSRIQDATGRGFPVIALSGGSKSWTAQPPGPPAGYANLYRGGVCVRDASGSCVGGEATAESGVGSVIGYIKTGADTGTLPVYRSTCYSNTSGVCTGWGLSLDANGTAVGYLSTTAPDTQSAGKPFIQSNGLLLQGLSGTASAYLWSANTQTTNHTDHFYSTDGFTLAGYSDEGMMAFLRKDSGAGAVALKRYVNSATGHHYYSTAADPPADFTEETTLGYLDTAPSTGLVALYRHFNSATSDYLLSISSTPPSGYALQTTLGYVQSLASSLYALYSRTPLGQVTQTQTAEVTYTYSYDAAHRLQSFTDSRGNKQLTYAYSPAGLLTSMNDSDGNQTSYEYDLVGRLTKLQAPNNGLVSFIYDNGGRLIEKWLPNGTTTSYSYNLDNNLNRVMVIKRTVSDTIISSHNYFYYDDVGNRQLYTERIGSETNTYKFVYDELNRLKEVRAGRLGDVIEGYTYDPLGNRTSKTAGGTTLAYVYDAANQLTEIRQGATTIATLTYDLNGNLTQKAEGSTTTTLSYDALNRLIQADKTGLSTQTYLYDDQGRRIQKNVGGAITNFLYSGPDIVGQYGSTWGSPSATYTHGPNMDDPIIRIAGATAQYYHQDGLGSAVAVTNASGTTDATARYDAWGNLLSGTGSIPQYGYTGREPDETGLVNYRNRYYDPTIGRFIQRDPIGMNGGLNLYAYVQNNPINFNDPLGLTAEPANTNVVTQQQNYFNANTNSGLSSDNQSLANIDSGDAPFTSGGLAGTLSGLSTPTLKQVETGFVEQVTQPAEDVCLDCSGNLQGGYLRRIGGAGGIVSGSAEAGVVAGGAVTGSIGGGIFAGGSQGVNAGGFTSFGGFLGGPGLGPSYPSGNSGNVVGGAYAGVGGGLFITNATSPTELKGPFQTYSFNLGIGPKISFQFGISGGTWIFSGTYGFGCCVSGSGYQTNTWTTK